MTVARSSSAAATDPAARSAPGAAAAEAAAEAAAAAAAAEAAAAATGARPRAVGATSSRRLGPMASTESAAASSRPLPGTLGQDPGPSSGLGGPPPPPPPPPSRPGREDDDDDVDDDDDDDEDENVDEDDRRAQNTTFKEDLAVAGPSRELAEAQPSVALETEMLRLAAARLARDESPSVRAIRPERSTEDLTLRLHHLKRVRYKQRTTAIITQNENGPCPLLAIANTLLLLGKIQLPEVMQFISVNQLVEYIADVMLESVPRNLDAIPMLNYEQNMHDAIALLPSLHKGLDVNVRFTGVRDFEFTPECVIFDILDISLYHGWVVDPQCEVAVRSVGPLSYNQLVERILVNKSSADEQLATDALLAEEFLNNTAAQLTYHGLYELNACMREDELAVFFRNNHFSTVVKRGSQLYLLLTDQGFLQEPTYVWELLCSIDGDGEFVDENFLTASPKRSTSAEELARQQQILLDEELAREMEAQERQAAGLAGAALAREIEAEERRAAGLGPATPTLDLVRRTASPRPGPPPPPPAPAGPPRTFCLARGHPPAAEHRPPQQPQQADEEDGRETDAVSGSGAGNGAAGSSGGGSGGGNGGAQAPMDLV